MNCKPGDLAVIVGAYGPCRDLLGRVVTVVGWAPSCVSLRSWLCEGSLHFRAETPKRKLPEEIVGRRVALPDAWLRPIRDQPGEDESLQWADVPNKETA